jgi:hypothetical protein
VVREGRAELIWDSDLSPERAALEYTRKVSDELEILFGAGFFYITERKAGDDTYMGGAQLGKKGIEEEVDFKRLHADIQIKFWVIC